MDKYKKIPMEKVDLNGALNLNKAVIKRQALIDQTLVDNPHAMKSLAEKKRLWKGEEGKFSKQDLAQWYRIYNQTKITEMKGDFKKRT